MRVFPLLLMGLLARPALGVSYTTKNLELIKRVGAHRSVIYPNQEESAASVERRQGEALTGLGTLGANVDDFVHSLRSPGNPYPLLRNVIKDYTYLRPPEQSVEAGRMYIMYVGELRWPFPAPLLADMLRLRVAHEFPQPLKDLLTTVLVRWGRDYVDTPSQQSRAMRREAVAGLIDELDAPEIVRIRWRHDQAVSKLLVSPLEPDQIAALQELAQRGEVRTRVAALRVLGTSGYVTKPAFFANLLQDSVSEVQHAAFWGLVYMPGDRALPHIQGYAGRARAIGARLKEARAGVTAEVVAGHVSSFDAAVTAITGKQPVAATPFVVDTSPAALLDHIQRSAARVARDRPPPEDPEPVPEPKRPEPEARERKPVVPKKPTTPPEKPGEFPK